jgi:hypothetical protein
VFRQLLSGLHEKRNSRYRHWIVINAHFHISLDGTNFVYRLNTFPTLLQFVQFVRITGTIFPQKINFNLIFNIHAITTFLNYGAFK